MGKPTPLRKRFGSCSSNIITSSSKRLCAQFVINFVACEQNCLLINFLWQPDLLSTRYYYVDRYLKVVVFSTTYVMVDSLLHNPHLWLCTGCPCLQKRFSLFLQAQRRKFPHYLLIVTVFVHVYPGLISRICNLCLLKSTISPALLQTCTRAGSKYTTHGV